MTWLADKADPSVDRALAPGMDLPVGRLHDDARFHGGEGWDGIEDRTELVVDERALLPCIEHTHDSLGTEVLDEMDHDGEAAFHVGGTQTEEPIALDARSDVALERNGVGVTDEGNLAWAGLAHHEGRSDVLLGMAGETVPYGVSNLLFVARFRRDVDEPDEGLGECHFEEGSHRKYSSTVITESVKAVGLASFSGEKVLDVWYPDPTDADTDLAQLATVDEARGVEQRPVVTEISDLSAPPRNPADAYLRLHLLSHRVHRPHDISVEGIFGVLNNVVWTTEGPCDVEGFTETKKRLIEAGRPPAVTSVDKFPRMIDYVIPTGVRIADGDRVRLGAYLGEGTTVMHEGFVNFNAGTLGKSMVEGRISAGVLVGDGSDVGGSASIMGTLSGGGTEVISIGENCLLGANSGVGISLGDGCVVEAGLYLTAGTIVTLPDGETAKGREMSGVSDMLFRRNSVSGAVEALPRTGSWGGLNEALHVN